MFACCSTCCRIDTDEGLINEGPNPAFSYGDSAQRLRSSDCHPGFGQFGAGRSLHVAERTREKERLQEMVKEFARNAVVGQKCDIIHRTCVEEPFSVVRSRYALSRTLNQFTLFQNHEHPRTFQMTQIKDIVKSVENTDLADCANVASIAEQLSLHFVGLIFFERGEKLCHGLLLPNEFERERFFTCMKILRVAIDSKRNSQ